MKCSAGGGGGRGATFIRAAMLELFSPFLRQQQLMTKGGGGLFLVYVLPNSHFETGPSSCHNISKFQETLLGGMEVMSNST